jgi:hypothetical protein
MELLLKNLRLIYEKYFALEATRSALIQVIDEGDFGPDLQGVHESDLPEYEALTGQILDLRAKLNRLHATVNELLDYTNKL